MSSAVSSPAPAPHTTPLPRRGLLRALVALAALGGLGTLGVLALAGGWFDGGLSAGGAGWTAVLTLWCLSPFALAVVVAVGVRRAWPRGLWAVLVGEVALVALTAVLLHDMLTSESSTAALLLLFLPLYQGALLVLTLVAAAVTHRLRRTSSGARA